MDEDQHLHFDASLAALQNIFGEGNVTTGERYGQNAVLINCQAIPELRDDLGVLLTQHVSGGGGEIQAFKDNRQERSLVLLQAPLAVEGVAALLEGFSWRHHVDTPQQPSGRVYSTATLDEDQPVAADEGVRVLQEATGRGWQTVTLGNMLAYCPEKPLLTDGQLSAALRVQLGGPQKVLKNVVGDGGAFVIPVSYVTHGSVGRLTAAGETLRSITQRGGAELT